MADPQVPEPRAPEGKDWLGAGGSVFAIVLSVLGLNRSPSVRVVVVTLMLAAAATGVVAVVTRRYRRATTAAAVVLVLAAVGVLTLAPEPADSGPPTVPAASAGPQLVVSQVDVLAAEDEGAVATLDVTVRNDGQRLAVLTGFDLTIDGFGFLPACLYGSNLEVTAKYSATLPDNPKQGQVVHVTLHQQVEPGKADRFTIGLRAPRTHNGKESSIDAFVYLLRVSVVQDSAGGSVAGGSVLVDAGAPLDANGTFYFGAPREATAADVGTGGLCGGEADCVRTQVACWNANRAILLPLLAVPAARSEGGDAAASSLGTG
jgi:hypothetical protein